MKSCFFCQRKFDDDATFYNIEAYNLCEECKSKMEEGKTFIGVIEQPCFENQQPICIMKTENGEQIGLYPTSEWLTLTENTIKEFYKEDAERILKYKTPYIFVTSEIINDIKEFYKNTKVEKGDKNEQTSENIT